MNISPIMRIRKTLRCSCLFKRFAVMQLFNCRRLAFRRSAAQVLAHAVANDTNKAPLTTKGFRPFKGNVETLGDLLLAPLPHFCSGQKPHNLVEVGTAACGKLCHMRGGATAGTNVTVLCFSGAARHSRWLAIAG